MSPVNTHSPRSCDKDKSFHKTAAKLCEWRCESEISRILLDVLGFISLVRVKYNLKIEQSCNKYYEQKAFENLYFLVTNIFSVSKLILLYFNMSSIDLATRFKIGMYLLHREKHCNAFMKSTDIIPVLNKLPTQPDLSGVSLIFIKYRL